MINYYLMQKLNAIYCQIEIYRSIKRIIMCCYLRFLRTVCKLTKMRKYFSSYNEVFITSILKLIKMLACA